MRENTDRRTSRGNCIWDTSSDNTYYKLHYNTSPLGYIFPFIILVAQKQHLIFFNEARCCVINLVFEVTRNFDCHKVWLLSYMFQI